MGNDHHMFYINELDPSQKNVQQQLADIYKDISNKIWDIDDEITYILHHYYHSKNMDHIDSEVISYLQRHGLKISDREPKNGGEFKHEVRQFEKSYDNQQAEQISLMV